jgi:hypothetical protein
MRNAAILNLGLWGGILGWIIKDFWTGFKILSVYIGLYLFCLAARYAYLRWKRL